MGAMEAAQRSSTKIETIIPIFRVLFSSALSPQCTTFYDLFLILYRKKYDVVSYASGESTRVLQLKRYFYIFMKSQVVDTSIENVRTPLRGELFFPF